MKRIWRSTRALALSALGIVGACGGDSPDGPGGGAALADRDGALVFHVRGGDDAGDARAIEEARMTAIRAGGLETPVLTTAAGIPELGGQPVFFQIGGEYRRCGRMEPDRKYGLAWRSGGSSSDSLGVGESVVLDVCVVSGSATLEVRSQGDGTTLLEVGPGWSTLALPLIAGARPESVEISLASNEPAPTQERGSTVLLGNARVRRASVEPPPTVLLVTFDTSRADHFSSISPDSPAQTPHFDRVAAEGVLYTNCYSSTNVTNPSHITLMTGVSPRDTKIVDNHTPLHHSATTLAEAFEAAGYQTYAALSAFHLAHELSGLGQGFQRLNTTPDFARSGEETLGVANDWLADADGSPLFLWFHLFDPHAPYRLPDSRLRRLLEGRPDPYAGEERIEGPWRITPKWARKDGFKDPAFLTALYGGGVEYLDSLFGRLLENDRFDDATIAVTADHGEGLGERDVWWDHSGTFYPMLHVPLAIRHPKLTPGEIIGAPVENRSLATTLLDLVDLPASRFQGEALPVEAGATGEQPSARFAMAAHGGSAAIEEEGWILEMFLKERDVDSSGRVHAYGSCYLYNAKSDPGCRENLVAVEYERAKAMRSSLIEWVQSAEVTGMNPVNHDVDPKVLAKLAQMGYSGGLEEVVEWWAPTLKDASGNPTPWAKSPWNLGFTAKDGQERLREAVEQDEHP
ncbi:MAG: sulfatase [Planctomycetota bacterium]